jgi:hypothetical protein
MILNNMVVPRRLYMRREARQGRSAEERYARLCSAGDCAADR